MNETLPRSSSWKPRDRNRSGRELKTMIGRSDQSGCARTNLASAPTRAGVNASSVTRTAPTPASARAQSSLKSPQTIGSTPAWRRHSSASVASRPVGASRAAVSESSARPVIVSVQKLRRATHELGRAAQHPSETRQGRTDPDSLRKAQAVLADRVFMSAAALLDDRHRLPHLPFGLEVAQQDDGVGQVADVD